MRRNTIAGLSATFALASVNAQWAEAAEARLRVVDVGNAMCVIAEIPGGHFMLYDAGNFNTSQCAAAVRQIVGSDRIDLVVLSHSDADHVGELPAILRNNRVDRLIYTGYPGTAARTWPRVLDAIEALPQGAVRNLQTNPLPNVLEPSPGEERAEPLVVRLGGATITFVAGWSSWPFRGDRRAEPSDSERRNAISIVVRFEFGGQSVLLTGDTIGRRGRRTEPENACRDSEDWMVHQGNAAIDSDVLVGQHHGGDNSSSGCFIEAVTPTFVVFPAGGDTADHGHPRDTSAQRFLSRGVLLQDMFRTDRGDDEPGDEEWDEGLERSCADRPGDDDVEIILSDQPGTPPRVRYMQPRLPCP